MGTTISAKLLRMALALVIALGLSPICLAQRADVAYAAQYSATNSVIEAFDATSDGAAITLSFSGKSYSFQEDVLVFAFADGASVTYKVCVNNDIALKTTGWQDVAGATGTVARPHDAAHNWGEVFDATLTIPLSALPESGDFTMTFCGTPVTSAQLGIASGSQGAGAGAATSGDSSSGDSAASSGSGTTESGAGTGSSGGTTEPGAGTGSSTASPVNIGTLAPTASGKITVDGQNGDWTGVEGQPASGEGMDEWKLARDVEGNVYLMFDGTADSEWDYTYQWANLTITQNGKATTVQVVNLAQIGATCVIQNDAHHNTAAPYVVEAMIPASYFTDPGATLELVGQNKPFHGEETGIDEVPVVDGTDVTPETPTVYEGIVIDGQYSDWAPVTKHDANDVGGDLEKVAMVWDGDTVYLYLSETPGTNGAYNAGTHGNGKYEIITDLGERRVFQLNQDGTVSGIDGAVARHVGSQWEISVPASVLPPYSKTIGFGMYQSDPMVDGVANLDGSGSGGTFAGVQIDGVYGDWEFYPHQLIEYATAGTGEQTEDASGALYVENGMLYGHVQTQMQRHLDNDKGNEFTRGVTIRFNDDTQANFYFRSTTVGDNGAIDWNPQMRDLPNGTYEFSIVSLDAWGNSATDTTRNEHDTEYGTMYVTIADGQDQCEFNLDLEKVAAKLGMNANDFKTIAAQFINVGNEWITYAGTSTSPFVGIGLGVGTVACVLGWRRLRGAKARS